MDNPKLWTLIVRKLSGEASADDLKELESMLRCDPALHYSLEALQDVWQKKANPALENAEAAYQHHFERMKALGIDMGNPDAAAFHETFPDPPRRKWGWKSWTVLASTLLLAIISYTYYTHPSTTISQKPHWEVVTHNGTRTNLLLPDGSSVWLNAGSSLSYDSLYGTKLREVSLSGEAYFDVVRNPEKPFIIHTGKINIKVLGTTFNVKSYPEEKTIETSLIRGSIEVSFPSLPSKKIILHPNQKLVVNKTESAPANEPVQNQPAGKDALFSIQHLVRTGSDSAIVETGWMQNRLYFNDMSFHDLLKNMERKYGVMFKLSDTSLEAAHFTGSFQDETVSEALDALRITADKATADFSYDVEGNQIFIYSNSGEHPTQPQ